MGVIPNKDFKDKIHFMFVGAHPDDADMHSGGTAIKFIENGHRVTFVALTNGDAGHHKLSRKALAERRRAESKRVATYLGLEYIVMDNHDGELVASIENRKKLIKLIREKKPDIIVTHRPNDYHPDHRNTSLLVQDSAYMVAVPAVCPKVPRLDYNPVILYHQDNFKKPNAFYPNIFVDITDVIDKKIRAISLHESQVFEWLPFIEKYENEIPKTDAGRHEWLKARRGNPRNVNQYLPILENLIPSKEYTKIKYIEAFEACEYGGRLTQDNAKKLFPFGIYKEKPQNSNLNY